MLGWNNIGQSSGENSGKSLEESLPGRSEVIAHYARTRELPAYIEQSTPRGSGPRCSLQLAFSSPGSPQLAFFVSFAFLFYCGQSAGVSLLLSLSLSGTQFGSTHTCVLASPTAQNSEECPRELSHRVERGYSRECKAQGPSGERRVSRLF